MEAVAGQVCIPGERLSSMEAGQSGPGTYVRHGYVFSSLTGFIVKDASSTPTTALPVISVKPKKKLQSVPQVGAVVTCKITQITPRFAKCQIIAVNNQALTEPFRGMIRKENVRETDRDRVEIYKCFHPGDIVLAKVLSLGDASFYLLSTAGNELGVVIAQSEEGKELIPLSHCEMQCPVTFVKENRKVARPRAEHLVFPDR